MLPGSLATKIFPVLATGAEVGARGERARAAGRLGIPAADFGGELDIVMVVENDGTLTWVDGALLESLPGEPIELARANLCRRTEQPLRRRQLAPDYGVWVIGEDDGLGSGRLLLHDLWAPIKATLPGELLVRIPNRGTVLCCSNVAADMAFADHATKYCSERARSIDAPPLSADWLMWSPEGWGRPEF